MKKLSLYALLALGALMPAASSAQLSTNPDKFLGNITTRGSVNGGGVEFASLWNQLTPENESKWASIEVSRNNFNWGGCDRCYKYCKDHDIPFKFHCLIWGSQYPGWMDGLSSSIQYREIIEWMDAIQKRYPDLDMIDVVNEAVPGHAPAPYKNALGGDGVTGYDWIIKAFELAHERWPDAILIYNDFNTFQWQKNEFINLVKVLRDAGAPIDAYGCQSHDLTDMGFSSFKQAMTEIQNALQMPMYSSEYDIGTPDDNKQLTQYRNQIKYLWEQPYVAGITLWGYIYGATWTTDGNSGIIRNGEDRPAMTWLREYMATDAAKTAKSPFPGYKKEASVYIRPETLQPSIYHDLSVTVDARLRTKTIDHVDFYINGELTQQMYEEPYTVSFVPQDLGHLDFKAVVYDTEGGEYSRLGGVNVFGERKPFHEEAIQLPGILEAEDFDSGGEGLTFHDSDKVDEGKAGYRTDNGGVDIGKGNGGYVIGYTAAGEWLEYTVDITEAGKYQYEAVVSSGMDGSSFQISLVTDEGTSEITDIIQVPSNGNWDSYITVDGRFTKRLSKGKQVLRISITGAYANIDKIKIAKVGGIEDVEDLDAGAYDVYTTTGIYVGRLDLSEVSGDLSAALYDFTHQSGIFVMRNVETGNTVKVAAH